MSEGSTNITFIQNHLPKLESGQYRIDTTLTLTGSDHQNVAQYNAKKYFYVSGKRYHLDAAEVSSVFPPLGSSGEYERVLPHIVLESSSLPWLRTTGSAETLTGGNRAPWLALLLFDESENIGAPQQVTLGTINASGPVFFPPRSAEPGETENDPVNVIDVPLSLFAHTCPPVKDLQWLAHVRQVSVRKKSTSQHKAQNDTYAVVISNRLPKPGRVSTMHLVSLEGYANYMPRYNASGNNSSSTHFPAGCSAIRLVSLYSWSFRCSAHQESFAGLLNNVNMNPATLQMPFTNDSASSSTSNTSVQNAFGMGYTAMNHQLRNGDHTVSWYRGPLLPLTTPSFVLPPFSNPDQLMRYDPTIGMLDASYAAAWQLGKLLALQDSAYAQTLVRWKSKQTDATAQMLEEAIIDEQLVPPQVGGQQARMKKQPLRLTKQSRISFSIQSIVAAAAAKINSSSNSNT